MKLEEIERFIEYVKSGDRDAHDCITVLEKLLAVAKAAKEVQRIPRGLTAAVAIESYLESQYEFLRIAFEDLEKD